MKEARTELPIKVIVYTTPTCVYCHALMDWLESKGITYEERDATKEADIKTVPVTEVDGQRIVGFDRPGVKKALKQAGLWS